MATPGQEALQERIRRKKLSIDKSQTASTSTAPTTAPAPVTTTVPTATAVPTVNPTSSSINLEGQSYNKLLAKGYTPEQIRTEYIKQKKIPTPTTAPLAPTTEAPITDQPTTGKSQDLGGGNMEDVTTPTAPVVETPVAPTTTPTTPEAPKPTADELRYADDSETRMLEIAGNLNTMALSNPGSFKDLSSFKSAFNYDKRSIAQKKLLDDWFSGYTNGLKLNLSSDSDIVNGYANGSITDNSLESLKLINPEKYALVQKGIERYKEFKKFENQLKGETDPVVDKANTTDVPETAKKGDFYEEYQKAISSPEVLKVNEDLTKQKADLEKLDLDLLDIKKNTYEEFKGTGANTSTIEAIIADRQSDLQTKRSKLAVDYDANVNRYNSLIGTAKDMLDAGVRKQEADMKERSAKLQELGFFYQYDPAGQAIQAEAKYNAENPDMDSKDPAKSRMALNQSLSQYFKDYGMIIQRSQSQVVGDVLKYAKTNNVSVSQALKDNFITPLQGKPEYQIMKDKALGIEKFDNKPFQVGDITYEKDKNGNYVIKDNSTPFTKVKLNEAIVGTGIISSYGNEVKMASTTADMLKRANETLKSQGINIKIGDNTVSAKVKQDAYNKWVAGGKKGPQQGGLDSYHITGQAFDLDQGSGQQNDPKVIQALLDAGFTRPVASEKRHWSYGEGKDMFGGKPSSSTITQGGNNVGYNPDYIDKYILVNSDKTGLATTRTAEQLGMSPKQLIEEARNWKVDNISKGVDRGLSSIDKIGGNNLISRQQRIASDLGLGYVDESVSDRRSEYNYIKDNLTMDKLVALKNSGATFGALSDSEREAIGNAATALKLSMSDEKFKETLGIIKQTLIDSVGGNYVSKTSNNTIKYPTSNIGQNNSYPTSNIRNTYTSLE